MGRYEPHHADAKTQSAQRDSENKMLPQSYLTPDGQMDWLC